jgi:cell wall-associated NlpC family hydrolase
MPAPLAAWLARWTAAAGAGRVIGGPTTSRRGFLALAGVGGVVAVGTWYQMVSGQYQLLQLAMSGNSQTLAGTCGANGADAASQEALSDIPPDYLALYQAAPATWCPGLSWTVLAGIGKVESDHGRSTGAGVTSGANPWGAAGPMQFGIGGAAGHTWDGPRGVGPVHPAPPPGADPAGYGYGVDGDGDGLADVYNPADAIPAAARYLAANGAPSDLRAAIFAYNHAGWYVDKVLAQAARYAGNGQAPAGCTATPLPAGVAGAVIRFALAQIGKPYQWGAEGPDAFDCSGLTFASYRAAGITIPRTAAEQHAGLPHVDAAAVQPADLIYFDVGPDRPGVDHCAVVYDPAAQQMIVAPSSGRNIQIQSYAGRAVVGFARPPA